MPPPNRPARRGSRSVAVAVALVTALAALLAVVSCHAVHRTATAALERRGEDRIDFVQPVKVTTEDDREYTLLTRDLSATGIRLFGTLRLLGQKVRVAITAPGQTLPTTFVVRILWTCAVGDGLVENGGAFLEVVG